MICLIRRVVFPRLIWFIFLKMATKVLMKWNSLRLFIKRVIKNVSLNICFKPTALEFGQNFFVESFILFSDWRCHQRWLSDLWTQKRVFLFWIFPLYMNKIPLHLFLKKFIRMLNAISSNWAPTWLKTWKYFAISKASRPTRTLKLQDCLYIILHTSLRISRPF